jgi:hypothetical protein
LAIQAAEPRAECTGRGVAIDRERHTQLRGLDRIERLLDGHHRAAEPACGHLAVRVEPDRRTTLAAAQHAAPGPSRRRGDLRHRERAHRAAQIAVLERRERDQRGHHDRRRDDLPQRERHLARDLAGLAIDHDP